jgi:hypothetical protein
VKDYLAILSEIPNRHSGLLPEQINRAASAAVQILRTYGMALPGQDRLPTYAQVKAHLSGMVNVALDNYFSTREVPAAKNLASNEIWGEDYDSLFSITVSGISEREEDGFTAEIDMNLLYDGSTAQS